MPSTAAGRDGAYRKVAAPAYAMRLDEPRHVPVGWQNDPLHGEPGDWLLQYVDGSHGVLRDQIFRESYGRSGETRWPLRGRCSPSLHTLEQTEKLWPQLFAL